jgi:uncharacterized phage protein (TIGR01671 family)
MMREIKFRAIRKRDKRLIWPIAIYQSGGDPVVEWLGPTGTTELSSTPGNEVWLMQYTGLKDANGREIYEGDIVADCTQITESGEWVTDGGKSRSGTARSSFCCRTAPGAVSRRNL